MRTNKTIKKHHTKRLSTISLMIITAAIALFSINLNVSESFAEDMYQIPIVKNIASVLTFQTYAFEKDNIQGDVTVATIEIDGKDLDLYINNTIQSKIDQTLAEAIIRADEYKEAYIETGGTEEGYADKNMQIIVESEIYLQTNHYLSFRVFTHENLAAVYAENLYFTIDLENKAILSLHDLLGKNYSQLIKEIVKKDVLDNPTKFFDDVKSDDWHPRDDLDFYMSSEERVTVVFRKYELAAGAEGRIEYQFEIK